jgi:hypothetical protein
VRLGGEGRTPADELPTTYDIRITTEDKTGAQIPASFRRFVASEWFRRALRQAEKKLPVGSEALPALYLEVDGRWWLVVRGGADAGESAKPRGVRS